MSYIRAEEVLPKELIETIQQYISGENIYIPCVEKKDWGSQTETRKYYNERNREREGLSMKKLILKQWGQIVIGLIIFSFGAKSMIRGLTAGAVKG